MYNIMLYTLTVLYKEVCLLLDQFNIGSTSGVTGALLLSVVGGKLSEGINFSDDLGRYRQQ